MAKRNRCLTFDIEARVHHASSVPQRQPTTMPATFSAILTELTELRTWRDRLNAQGLTIAANTLQNAINKLEAQTEINQVRS